MALLLLRGDGEISEGDLRKGPVIGDKETERNETKGSGKVVASGLEKTCSLVLSQVATVLALCEGPESLVEGADALSDRLFRELELKVEVDEGCEFVGLEQVRHGLTVGGNGK